MATADSSLKGRCISCGFLSKYNVHHNGPPPYFYEMPENDRNSGQMSGIRLDAGREIQGFPQCYVNAEDLWREIDLGKREGKNEYLHARGVFEKDRKCPKWHRYTPGFSPQEHLEELRAQELELKRQEFEQRMAADQKELMRKLDSGNKRVQLILGLVLGGIAVVEIIVGLLQVLYPTGFPWLQNLFGIKPPAPPSISPMSGS